MLCFYRISIGEVMAQMNLLQGTLDLLILRALAAGELHGLGVAKRVDQMTRGTFAVKPGSLFPALHRMERAGWVEGFWGESENRRRAKFYRMTPAGRKQLRAETAEWKLIAVAMAHALRSA